MMSFFPENEYNKRDLLLRTLLWGKLDELGLRDLTDPDTADKNNIYGHMITIKNGIEKCPVDFIYGYLLIVPPK
jgi:hypothetical protein